MPALPFQGFFQLERSAEIVTRRPLSHVALACVTTGLNRVPGVFVDSGEVTIALGNDGKETTAPDPPRGVARGGAAS